MKRRCSCCEAELPLDEKHFRKHGGGRIGYRCRGCDSRRDTIKRLQRLIDGGLLREARRLPPLADIERQHIERTVRLFGTRMGDAALQLGISKQTLYRKMLAYSKLPRIEFPRLRSRLELQTELSKLQELDRTAAARRRERAESELMKETYEPRTHRRRIGESFPLQAP